MIRVISRVVGIRHSSYLMLSTITQGKAFKLEKEGMLTIKHLHKVFDGRDSHIIGVNEKEHVCGNVAHTKFGMAFITILAIPICEFGRTIFFNERRTPKFKESINAQLPIGMIYEDFSVEQTD